MTQHSFRFNSKFYSRCLIALVATFFVAGLAAAQTTITPNYKDADIQQIIEAISEVTGKNFIIDPRVKAQVTMLSSTPMSPDAFYEAFLSILQVYGFVAVPSGDVIKILPDANARQLPGWENSSSENRRADDIVTKVVFVRNVAAAQLVPILRPLIPQYGHLAAHPASNMLIISDRSANVDRILSIINRIDQSSDDEIEVIRLQHASADETVRVVSSLQQSENANATSQRPTIVADARTNSVLVGGDKTSRLRLRALITHLDTPLENGGDTRVRYLRYSDAIDLAAKLNTQYSNATPEDGNPTVKDISIWADEQTNALVITAPPKTMRSMMTVIDKIDIRRAQVMVEAIIVEVSADKTDQLGVTWAAFNDGSAIGATNFPIQGTGIVGLAGTIIGDGTTADVSDAVGAILPGVNVGFGRASESGTSFAALIQALESNADTNIVATPTIVTMDNEEAEINVGQEVPFVTGSFTNTGGADGAVNPFQTIQREQIGLKLKITPQINEGDAVLLDIDQEISNVLSRSSTSDLVTSNRTVTTSVIVNDMATLVIGGLLQDDVRETEQRVPILGSIPFLGAFFRASTTEVTKTNLMIFIKPTILRDNIATTFATNQKYEAIRNMQLAEVETSRPFLRDLEKPLLPPLAEPDSSRPAIDLRQLDTPAATESDG